MTPSPHTGSCWTASTVTAAASTVGSMHRQRPLPDRNASRGVAVMSHDLVPAANGRQSLTVPAIIADAGDHAARRFLEFFTATIRNRNTRAAYAQAVGQFLRGCEARRLSLREIEPIHVAGYIERLQHRADQPLAAPSVKQHLAAIRTLFDWLVTGQVVPHNPAASVRGPKHSVT